jgi:preprotein translocase subunit YajC
MPALTLVAPIFEAAAKKQSGGSPILLIFVAIAAAFYFLIYRPQQRKAKAAREQTNTFDVGDEVLTAGGIVGYVIEIDGDRVTLETSVGASFVVMRQYVLRRIEPVVDADDDDDDESDHEYDDAHEVDEDEEADHADGAAEHQSDEEEHHDPADKPGAKGHGGKADDRGDSSNPDGPPII